ncbi:MAG: SusC/RagA family TonB-linked outer membrane protein [Paludibacter sp.]
MKAGLDFSFYNSNQKLTVSDESLIKIAMKQTPDVAARNADGGFDGPQTTEYVQTNPLGLAMLKENYTDKTGVNGSSFLEATLLKGLTFKTEINFGFGMDNAYKFTPAYTFGALVNNVIQSDRSKSYSRSLTFRNILNYNNTFAKVHAINVMLGQEAQSGGWEYLNGTRTGFVSNVAHDLSMGDASTATNIGSSLFSSLNSYFGRIFYSFDDRYLLTTTLRFDGSSKLAHRWDWFPLAALAWKVSNESFMKDIPSIYNLKLRLGWGMVGNQNATLGGNNYPYTSVLTSVQTIWGTGLLSGNTANPDLRWEKTSSSNLGLDLGLFKNRIEFTADLYYKKTDGLLLYLPLPAYVGTTGMGSTSAPVVNVGSIENKGFEFSLNTVNVDKKNFKWKSNVIFSLNRSKVLAMNSETGVLDGAITEGSETVPVTRTAVGQEVGLFYGYKVIGRFEKATDFYYKDKNGDIQPTALPKGMAIGPNGAWIGDYIFEDVNKDGVIDESDRTVIGNPAPKFTYGIGNTFSYKNWDLSVMLNGVYGNQVVNYQRRFLENARNSTNLLEKAMNYAVVSKIDPNGPVDYRNLYISGGNADMPRMAASAASSASNYRFSDRFLEDGSYLRIQNISIGYNLPQSVLKMLKIENLKIYANLQNVYTFTVYKGYDPEVSAMSPILSGIDNGRYPSPRIYTLGLNLTF